MWPFKKRKVQEEKPPIREDTVVKVVQDPNEKDITNVKREMEEKGYYLDNISSLAGTSLEWGKAILLFKTVVPEVRNMTQGTVNNPDGSTWKSEKGEGK